MASYVYLVCKKNVTNRLYTIELLGNSNWTSTFCSVDRANKYFAPLFPLLLLYVLKWFVLPFAFYIEVELLRQNKKQNMIGWILCLITFSWFCLFLVRTAKTVITSAWNVNLLWIKLQIKLWSRVMLGIFKKKTYSMITVGDQMHFTL